MPQFKTRLVLKVQNRIKQPIYGLMIFFSANFEVDKFVKPKTKKIAEAVTSVSFVKATGIMHAIQLTENGASSEGVAVGAAMQTSLSLKIFTRTTLPKNLQTNSVKDIVRILQ